MHGPTPPLPVPTDKLHFAMPPMHESLEDERRHRKERLAGALRLFVSDLVLANQDGQVVEGGHHVNQAAFAVHAQVHAARPDVVAVAHCHSVHGRALAALGELLDPITQESCAFYEDHALYDAYTSVTVDPENGVRALLEDAIGKGHRQIGAIPGLATLEEMTER